MSNDKNKEHSDSLEDLFGLVKEAIIVVDEHARRLIGILQRKKHSVILMKKHLVKISMGLSFLIRFVEKEKNAST